MKVMILDANSLLNRAFYGIRPLTAPDGTPTNAIYGFLSTYCKLFAENQPDGVAVCFDLKAPTFRHKDFDVYKAGRRPMPEELVQQMPVVKQLLDLMGVPRFELSGYEADDLIGTLSRVISEEGGEAVIVTGDRDALQLINLRVKVQLVTTKGGQTLAPLIDEAGFAERYCGLPPRAMIDLKALAGDSSDNIPGVRGIGEKTALSLLCRFHSLDGVYENLEDPSIRQSLREKLSLGRESAYQSYRLATIDRTAPIPFTPALAALRPRKEGELFDLMTRLGLKTFVSRLHLSPAKERNVCPRLSEPPAPEAAADLPAAISALDGFADAPVAVRFSDDFSAAVLTDGSRFVSLPLSSFREEERNTLFSRVFSGGFSPVLHDAKPVLRRLLTLGLSPAPVFFDTALACYLLSPGESGYPLDGCAVRYLGCPVPGSGLSLEGDALTLFGEEDAPAAGEEKDPALLALAGEAEAVWALFSVTREKLREDGLYGLMNDVELPLTLTLARMEHTGMLIDARQLSDFGKELSARAQAVAQEIYSLAGEEFNIQSTRAVSAVLFDRLGLPPGKKTKTGYSTDIEVLRKLAPLHPIVPLIIEYRQITKLLSTYVDGFFPYIAADGRIHTTFRQTVTATGRLSSTDPNLQNIPIRKELGSELRRMFAAPTGCLLIDADYSQIELRVLAHVAGDREMIAAFLSGEDIHAVTASEVFGVPLAEVTPRQRQAAKAVNFGIVYGISDFSLSEDLGVSRAEARRYIDSYLAHYSGVREYMEQIRLRAKEDGYVSTLLGRRRYLPELRSSNHNVRAFGERVALNAPIQGTAADIIKLAMLRVDRALAENGMKTRMVLQVHDELILEAPEEEAEEAALLLKREMEAAFLMKAPLAAEVSFGKSWFDAK